MTDLRVVDPRAFDEHLDYIEQVRTTFVAELEEGLRACEDRLYLLRVSLESTEELLDEARRDLSAAWDDDAHHDSARIDRLVDEVDELARERNRKQRAVDDGTASFRRLQDFADTAQHDFRQAAFRASVSMTENKARYRSFVAEEMSGSRQFGVASQSVVSVSTGVAGSANAIPKGHQMLPVGPHALPPLPANMAWVPLDAVDWSSIDEDIEFKIASRSEIQTLLRTFVETIVPMLSADRDLKVDRLAEIDAGRSRMPGDSDSLVGAWERLLSGSDQIALDTSRGAQHPYSINSGRHRILAARDIGMSHVPAVVSQTKASRGEQK
jgi:hypothetical protein